jgi:hypothetical protein
MRFKPRRSDLKAIVKLIAARDRDITRELSKVANSYIELYGG